ncbi:AraC family transcriptional regulator [Pararhodonellum marinum]|uniref:AraC family transcriptional regulator n=1 Tax=Pararhodonellum marinum TaxID=2755358 RepID=UPI00293B8DEC|nr:helix-turn-helix domain-containing protein [Pararhodonellum marinum]
MRPFILLICSLILNQLPFILGCTYMIEISIKHMVCPRCIMAVETALKQTGIPYKGVNLGKVVLEQALSTDKMEDLRERLEQVGFEVLKDRESQTIEKIKNLLHQQLNNGEMVQGAHLMALITENLNEDYATVSHLFSSTEGITIEKYYILLKVEKIKEWLFYQELTISEMAWKLGYSSVQHLSAQFKKVTGMTPSDYKKLNNKPRTALTRIGA